MGLGKQWKLAALCAGWAAFAAAATVRESVDTGSA